MQNPAKLPGLAAMSREFLIKFLSDAEKDDCIKLTGDWKNLPIERLQRMGAIAIHTATQRMKNDKHHIFPSEIDAAKKKGTL